MRNGRQVAKYIFCFFILLLLAIVILEPVGAQAPPEPGWHLFTEPGFGYQIQYPEGWHVSLVADNTQRSRRYAENVVLRSIGFFGPNSQIVFVDVWLNRSGFSLPAWLDRYSLPAVTDPAVAQTSEITAVAGRFAIRRAFPPPGNAGRTPWHYQTQLAHDDLIFSLKYAALEPDLAIYDHMLTSFRFQEPARQRLAPSSLADTLPPAEFGTQTATCCGITDFEYNPFPCNTAGDASCPAPPCGNCTWWVRYRRTGGNEANLTACTNDAVAWESCAAQYYPHLLSPDPDDEAVVLYPGVNHLSFVESVFGGTFYNASDLSWFASCPVNYFTGSAGGGKSYIRHPDRLVPNMPPNAPLLDRPPDEAWLNSRAVTLSWNDGGDPDDGPQANRSFLTHVWDDDWTDHSGWTNKTKWQLTLPKDGLYNWHSKAHDGMLESAWSERRRFGVDTTPPNVAIPAGQPSPGRWYNTDQSFSWTGSDPSPGSGVDYFKWAWDDNSPDKRVDGAQGAINLSNAGQGAHHLYLQFWDEVGNASAVTQLGWFGYDTLAPIITFDPGNPATGNWYQTPPTLAWTIRDPHPGAGVQYFKSVWDSPLLLQEDFVKGPLYSAQSSTVLNPAQGQHTLYLKAWDKTGNAGPIAALGWFGYDSLPPEPPSLDPGCDAPNNRWQNSCRTPDFTWAGQDAGEGGSGVSAYSYSWGSAAITPPVTWSSVTGYRADPIAGPGGWGKGYLHVRAKDRAANVSSPATYGIWYDGSIPTVTFTVNTATVALPAVQLNLTTADSGSGVAGVRIANNDQVWSMWHPWQDQIDWALSAANNPTHTVSLQVRDRAANESAVVSATLTLTVEIVASELPREPFAGLPDPPLEPDTFGLSFNQRALYTNIPTTTLQTWAPNVTHLRLSESPRLADQDWQPYRLSQTWVLSSDGDLITPHRLYVWFRDAEETIYGPYFDDIIYDAVAPKGGIRVLANEATTMTLLLSAWDDNSGVVEMRLAEDPSMAPAAWEPYANTAALPATTETIYAQFRDFAGNLSPVYGSDGSNSSQTEKAYLPLIRRQ